jgi:type IV pilus assembly protein PilY1
MRKEIMKTTKRSSSAARCVLAYFIGSLLWTPISHAVELADSPMPVLSYASPNILFTIDDSGSMDAAYSHESAMLEIIDGDYIPYMVDRACTKNSFANNLYYDPNKQYSPGLRADGSQYPDANFHAAYPNGYHPGRGYAVSGRNQKQYPSPSHDAYPPVSE